jgi:hypothetical protein
MKRTFSISMLIVCLLGAVSGQESARKENNQAVIAPQEVYLTVVVPQSDCPIRIEKTQIIRFFDGRFGKLYSLRNVGNKSIKSYTIAMWNSDNTGDEITWHINDEEGPLMPGQTIPLLEKDSTITILPLSEELRSKLDLRPPMKKVIFFMIVNVEFSDETKYSAESIFAALKKHLENFEIIYEKRIH